MVFNKNLIVKFYIFLNINLTKDLSDITLAGRSFKKLHKSEKQKLCLI
jgi:hypothetical protein